MRRNKHPQWIYFGMAAIVIASVWSVPNARADSISFTLAQTSLTTTSAGSVEFDGTITNNSGQSLNASDFFFNFSGYNPALVTPNQDVGLVIDFAIPNGTTTTTGDLFSVVLGTVPAGSSFPIGVQLEDVNGDLSAIQTVTVSVPSPVSTPEPSSLLLVGVGFLGPVLRRLRGTLFCRSTL